jgi:hypothetical protein
MTLYCTSCFKKINYSLVKPSQCPHCNYIFTPVRPALSTSAASPVSRTGEARSGSRPIHNSRAANSQPDEDGEEFFDPNYVEGKFSQFYSTKSMGIKRFGVAVEVDKHTSGKLGDLAKQEEAAEAAEVTKGVEAAASNPKRGRGRPRKSSAAKNPQ